MKGFRINFVRWASALLVLLIVVPLGWLLVTRLEGEKPALTVERLTSYLGLTQDLSLQLADSRSGLRSIRVALEKDGKEVVLLEREFPSAGFGGLLGGGTVKAENISLTVAPKDLGFSDGKGVFRILLSDYSWRNWWHGNRTLIEQEITIDTIPPEIALLSRAHYVNQGGAGLVIYRVSEPCQSSGVYVGESFFPGTGGAYKDDNIHMTFIALDHLQGTDTEIYAATTDFAGNTTRIGVPHLFRKKAFKEDVLPISDQFLAAKMPEFYGELPDANGKPLLDQFLMVNRDLRKANTQLILSQGTKTTPEIQWEGDFLRLPNSERKSGFADHRRYRYNDQIVDDQYHMGVDLASLAGSPVPAANRGRVVFTGTVGIYGKTVILDHGMGLFSTYSHLSRIDVQPEQVVARGENVGITGTTGMAGGDHLHYGMFIHNTFVTPVEWWDPHWIKDNITDKMAAAGELKG